MHCERHAMHVRFFLKAGNRVRRYRGERHGFLHLRDLTARLERRKGEKKADRFREAVGLLEIALDDAYRLLKREGRLLPKRYFRRVLEYGHGGAQLVRRDGDEP